MPLSFGSIETFSMSVSFRSVSWDQEGVFVQMNRYEPYYKNVGGRPTHDVDGLTGMETDLTS